MSSNFGLSTSQYIIDTIESELKRLMTGYCARLALHISKEFDLSMDKVEISLNEFASTNLGNLSNDEIINIPKPSKIPGKKIPKKKVGLVSDLGRELLIKENIGFENSEVEDSKLGFINKPTKFVDSRHGSGIIDPLLTEGKITNKNLTTTHEKQTSEKDIKHSCQRVKQRQIDPCGKPAKRTILFNGDEIWVCGADKSGCYFDISKKNANNKPIKTLGNSLVSKNQGVDEVTNKLQDQVIKKESKTKQPPTKSKKEAVSTKEKIPQKPKAQKKEKNGKMSVSDVKSLVPTIVKNKGEIPMKATKIGNKIVYWCEGLNGRKLTFDKKNTEFYGVLNGENILPLERMDVKWIESKGHYAKVDNSSTQSKHISRDGPSKISTTMTISESETRSHKMSIKSTDGDEAGDDKNNIFDDDENASLETED